MLTAIARRQISLLISYKQLAQVHPKNSACTVHVLTAFTIDN